MRPHFDCLIDMLNLVHFSLSLGLAVFFVQFTALADEVDFEKQVKPILNRRCGECHGGKQREGGLRFTDRQDALSELDSGGFAIVAGAPADGSLLSRITSQDESDRMPPEGERLSRDEIEVIKRWIAEGAKWSDQSSAKHWAYIAPKRPPLPAVAEKKLVAQ